MRPAVFLDRDGTINKENGYISDASQFLLLPGSAEAISLLNKNNYLVVVTTNQSGVARGYFPIEVVQEIHGLMEVQLTKNNASIDKIYFCPHHSEGVVPEYSIECVCRKPGTGFINKARSDLDIDISRSYVIGDRWLDIEFARNANLPGILVLTGYGREDLEEIIPQKKIKPAYVARDLLHAVKWILKQDAVIE